MNQPTVRQATPQDLDRIKQLLDAESLPTTGVAEYLQHFLVAEKNGLILGAIGLEVYGETALLRSVVVSLKDQRTGIGSMLYSRNLEQARRLGVRKLVLLTNTAEAYFAKRGFRKIDQKSVTGPITTSVEFTGACPSNAVCMEMTL
ncbi:MAG: arsenic resistance N-acetyltransferase ArsN2 [Bacteroidota bacterium]